MAEVKDSALKLSRSQIWMLDESPFLQLLAKESKVKSRVGLKCSSCMFDPARSGILKNFQINALHALLRRSPVLMMFVRDPGG